ncbi:MAG: SDR family NAD(P)-dependent oxidoreductase [Thermoguttaceae bacterium]
MSRRSPSKTDSVDDSRCQRSARDFSGRTIFVAGATGGIGSAVAKTLAAAGGGLILHYGFDGDTANRVADDCAAFGVSVDCEQADLANREQVASLTVRLTARTIDHVVIASGCDLMNNSLRQKTFDERLRYLLEVDLVAPMVLARTLGAKMQTSETLGRSIVFLGWDGVATGGVTETAQLYGAVKGGLQGFAQSLSQSLAPQVRVNTLLLGWIKTRWGNKVAADDASPFSNVPEKTTLLERWGESEEVADAVRFLLSDESRYITGATLEVNGGRRAWRPE